MGKRLTGVLVLACLLSSTAVWGENTERDTLTQQQGRLNEVLIQSFKRQRDLKLEPMSATVVDGSMIVQHNIIDIKGFSALVPNLFVPDYGSKLTSPVYIRGIGSKINAPSVGLYVDGLPYFEKSAFDVDFSEVERMEVLRGPQGTLYGRNTMGGMINVYTYSPLTYQGTQVGLSVGNYGYQRYNASHYGKVNDSFGYSVSGNYQKHDGYFMNETTKSNADPLKSGAVRAKLQWRPADGWTLGLSTVYDMLDQGGYPYGLVDAESGKVGPVNYNNYSSYKRNLSTTGLSVDYIGAGYSVHSRTAAQFLEDWQKIDQDFSPEDVYFANQDMKQKMFSEELNIKSTGESDYKWIVGAFGFYQQIDNLVGVDYKKQQFSTLKTYDTPTMGVALYHQSTFDNLLVDGLSLTLGLRYDYERARNDYNATRTAGGKTSPTGALNDTLSYSQFSPKVALQYIFPSSGIVYVTATKGYKTGGFNTSFDKDDEHTFGPETSWNYELGIKHPFLDNRLSAEVCFFYIDWKNQQIYQMLASQRGQMLRNAGRSASKGVEVSMLANPVNGLTLQANYGYTHATFTEHKDERKKLDYSGNFLPQVPMHTIAVGGDYTISYPTRFLDRITFGAHYIGNGEIYRGEDNKVKEPFYGVVNAQCSATHKFATLTLWAKNLTNTDYKVYYFEMGPKAFAQKGRPMTFGANLNFKF